MGTSVPQQIAAVLDVATTALGIESMLMIGWGSGDDDLAREFANSAAFRDSVLGFVKKGGRFLVQGERIEHCCGSFPEWFGLPWKSSSYFRTEYGRNDNCWLSPYATNLPSKLNVKACTIVGVESNDQVFQTTSESVRLTLIPSMSGGESLAHLEDCAFAAAKVEEGIVAYFGDVNAESPTIRAVLAILSMKVN